jgi:hypothetical protein
VFHRYHGSSDRHGPAWLQTMSTTNRVRTLLKNGSLGLLAAQCWPLLWLSAKMVKATGPEGSRALLRALRSGLAVRPEVTALCKKQRTAVEARWRVRRRSQAGQAS